jgi:hypothetical protein
VSCLAGLRGFLVCQEISLRLPGHGCGAEASGCRGKGAADVGFEVKGRAGQVCCDIEVSGEALSVGPLNTIADADGVGCAGDDG